MFVLVLGGLRTDKEPTGQKPLSVLKPSSVILNSGFESQYFFFFVRSNDKHAVCRGVEPLLGIAEATPFTSVRCSRPWTNENMCPPPNRLAAARILWTNASSHARPGETRGSPRHRRPCGQPLNVKDPVSTFSSARDTKFIWHAEVFKHYSTTPSLQCSIPVCLSAPGKHAN